MAGEADPVRTPGAGAVLWYVPDARTATRQFVDVQRDATVADLVRAVGAGMRSMEHIKRYTTIGTAHDQGKTSGVVASGITAELLGSPAGGHGRHHLPAAVHPGGVRRARRPQPGAHVRSGAGHRGARLARGPRRGVRGRRQWKRPRYYPLRGEDMDAAVLRECAAVRSGVGILDGSTLGKIDVQGPDAGEFLDMLYTNLMSSLKVGMIRYGVMCGVDGMVIDDGTVMRLADDRFQVFTTTGGAAHILDWMEEWLQTEWPHLRVRMTSVTEQWHTFPVVGPKSRDVIGAVFADLDVSNDAFPFMAWRDTTLDGAHVRVGRVSFSGELAYEVNVMGWYATAVWEKLIAAGERHGITPYGTETMHVLRAEKGYPIIGQDTDGTITPQDLGMNWVVSKKKVDFIGKRSFTRSENLNPLRKQFVGLLPDRRGDRAARGRADHRAQRGRRTASTARADARARHVELPQRRVGAPVRAGPGQGRPRPHRRHLECPGQRNPGAGGGHRFRPRRSRRSPPRWLTPSPDRARCRASHIGSRSCRNRRA